MRQAKLIFILLLLPAILARADSLNLSFFQSSTDNLFQTYFAEKDQVSSLSFSLDKEFKPFSLFSEGSFSYIYHNTDISYYAQDIGVDYVRPLNDATALYLAVKAMGALYRSEYTDFNFLSFEGMAATKTYLSQTSILKLSYRLDYKKYNSRLFDFISHLANVSVDKYLETQTTLKAELSWGYKYFFHPFQALGHEPSNEIYSATSRRGKGPGHISWLGSMAKSIPGGKEQGQGLQIVSLSALLAQGLGSRIGLSFSGLRQWTLSGENPFRSIEEYYWVENPTYDFFAWNGILLGTLLTVEAPWNAQIKIGYTKMSKKFPGVEALDAEGNTLGAIRKDQRNLWEARLEKNFPSFSIYCSYQYIDNSSNDPLFRWRGYFVSGGIGWNIFWGEKK